MSRPMNAHARCAARDEVIEASRTVLELMCSLGKRRVDPEEFARALDNLERALAHHDRTVS